MHLACWNCRCGFRLEQFNLCRITVECPTCGRQNDYAEAIAREYGKNPGDVARFLVSALRTLTKRSDSSLSIFLVMADKRIKEAVQTAKGEA